jgi:YggT family protein
MMSIGLTRGDIADYLAALIFVYTVLIVVNVVLSWVRQFRPLPYNVTLRRVIGFIEESTDPYLNVFRRFVPRIGPLDVSPIVAIIVLSVVGGIVVNVVNG